ncbi:glutamate--tRNA ligase [Brevibacterium daeguense]|uniref:Glutamate--tRNA ligase n=1 Tax=Brevibacterium daeguense TaxID=909936 RepID=A0ABP8ELT3_9MICO|nr:glutamate--tRNA ligase [Brevibacterium daeguense]
MSVKVRFCPSPTGTPHVGMVRTALFNWAYAKHTGGTFVFRIEDTDAARDSEESYGQVIEAMRWLGLDWDEGIEVGGPDGPYRQSQRGEIYAEVIEKLRAAGHLYESFSTNEEIEARHREAGRDPKLGYDGYDRNLTEEQKAAFRAEGREPVLRVRMPDADVTFHDLVRGEITFKAGSVPDFVVVRANGRPLYTFVNPVDDALMGITHVLRGEDLLSSTPRQLVLFEALKDVGVAEQTPEYGHLPYVMGQGNKKLSKRDPESNLFLHRDNGFIREGLINYLALLGWSIGPDRDVFSVEEFVEAFDIADVNPNPARFDVKKATAINADHIRMLDEADFTQRMVPYLQRAGIVGETLSEDEQRVLTAAAPLVQTRMNLLGEAPDLLRFLFVSDDELELTADGLKTLKDNAGEVLAASLEALEPLSEWTTDSVQTALQGKLVDELGIKPRLAFGPLRVAVSGRRVSPPLFESMEILGRESSLARLRALAAHLAASREDTAGDADVG